MSDNHIEPDFAAETFVLARGLVNGPVVASNPAAVQRRQFASGALEQRPPIGIKQPASRSKRLQSAASTARPIATRPSAGWIGGGDLLAQRVDFSAQVVDEAVQSLNAH